MGNTSGKRFRPRLATKIFVITTAVILLVMAAAAVLTAWWTNRIARRAVVADLASGYSGQETFQETRDEQLLLISELAVSIKRGIK